MRVSVYWNLHRKCYSVQHKGRVIRHARELILKDVEFRVRQGGRAKVLETGRKNVHAFVIGELVDAGWIDSARHVLTPRSMDKVRDRFTPVTYNPYAFDSFVTKWPDITPVHSAASAVLITEFNGKPGMWADEPGATTPIEA